eukprot:UN07075
MSGSRTETAKKIFVGAVPKSATHDEFKTYFKQFGDLVDAILLMDNAVAGHKGKVYNRGFGFVKFRSKDVAEKVIGMKSHTFKGNRLNLNYCKIPLRTNRFFIGGLCAETTEAQLRDYFSRFGEVEDILLRAKKDSVLLSSRVETTGNK